MQFIKSIPPHIQDLIGQIREVAQDEYDLDFFETIFEMVDYEQINEIAAFGGFPTRYPHWRFGMEYDQLSKGQTYGVSQIYEMVINNNPSYAYLLEGNNLVDQKTVIAHVYAHVDFFKNNYYFSKTNRNMIDEMANHGARIRRYVDQQGIEQVEDFIDTCLTFENLIDYHKPFIERRRNDEENEDGEIEEGEIPKFDAKNYMEDYINPEEFLEAQKERLRKKREQSDQLPSEPREDVMLFLLEHAPLERWQADILSMIREEAYYFAPQKQTKIMNEGWACVAPETPIFTEEGLVPMARVVDEADEMVVSDGETLRDVEDCHVIRDHETVTIEMRRGLELTGSNNHRVMLADGDTWRRLDELEVGDEIRIAGGAGTWPDEPVEIDWSPPERITLDDVADRAGVSIDTVIRFRNGESTRSTEAVEDALAAYETDDNQSHDLSVNARDPIQVPERVTPELGAFLGYMLGDGHISRTKRHLGLTSADRSQIERFAELSCHLFGCEPDVEKDGNRWRARIHSEHLSDFLQECFGLPDGPSASEKTLPDAILRSPESVVASCLRALFDADGYAGEQGVILSTSSDEMSRRVQLLLLNFGVLSRRREQSDGCWHVHVTGRSARRFDEAIGFGLERKSEELETYLEDREWFQTESWTDEIASIEHGRGDVYDITVEETHRYAGGGVVNHNSYWHSKILTEEVLDDSEIVDFADIHSSVMATQPGSFNPYKLGIELFRDIKERWDKGKFGKEWDEVDDLERKANWDKQLGKGTDKIFEVRQLYNDVTFIDEFLTEEFCREQKLFTYEYNPKQDTWEIASRKFEAIKDKLLSNLTNFGEPRIYVRDGNFRNRGELLLHHKYEGRELRHDHAREVLEAISRVWQRPVNLETIVDGEGHLLTYDVDADEHSDEEIEYNPI
jgi:stage V sporulation protein R